MSTDTPSESITALLAYSQADEEGIIVTVSRQAIHEVVRENARLREELAIQSNANVGLMEELAEAKRDTGLAKLVIQQKQDQIASAEAALEQAEARALAAEKAHQRSHAEVMRLAEELRKYQPGSPMILNATTGAKHETS